jgi:hypothetical protein
VVKVARRDHTLTKANKQNHAIKGRRDRIIKLFGESMSNLFFYEYELQPKNSPTSSSIIVSGLVNPPIVNPDDAEYILLAIRSDIVNRKGCSLDEFNQGRLIGIVRV